MTTSGRRVLWPAKGDFWVVFRTYGPGKGIVEQTWEMPGLTKVN